MRVAYGEAIRLLEEVQAWTDLGETHVEFAQALRAEGDHEAAEQELARADEIFASIGAAEASEAIWATRPGLAPPTPSS
jgi:hypothetical protein